MSKGKYSPSLSQDHIDNEDYEYNCLGLTPEGWNLDLKTQGVEFNAKTMFGNYDSEGFDRYGYSAFDHNGNFVGDGEGVDRWGYTENDYLAMSDEMFVTVVDEFPHE